MLLLREAPDEEDVVALLDCKSEITEVRKWVGEGAKATLVGTANADILEKIIEKLRATIQEQPHSLSKARRIEESHSMRKQMIVRTLADYRTQTPRSGQTGRKGSYSGGRRHGEAGLFSPARREIRAHNLRRGSGVTTGSRDVRALTLWQGWNDVY